MNTDQIRVICHGCGKPFVPEWGDVVMCRFCISESVAGFTVTTSANPVYVGTATRVVLGVRNWLPPGADASWKRGIWA